MPWTEKLPSGKYRAGYRDSRGRRKSAGSFPHKVAAMRAAAAAEAKARRSHGVDPDEASRPWGEWAREVWWDRRDVTEETLANDRSRLRVRLAPVWDDVPIGTITRMDVRDWQAKMRRDGVSAATSNRSLALLSASLQYAVDRDVIDANPCRGISKETEPSARERFLTPAEFGSILEHLPTMHDRLIALTLAYTGMRWSELAGLHWSRVDLAGGQIMVAETFPANATKIKAWPKSTKPRAVPIMGAVLTGLVALDGPRRGSCGVAHSSGICPSPLVFTTERGRPIRNSHWSLVWHRATEAADLPEVRIHDLRHTYASWLLQAGRPIAEVSKLLGHSSIVTTERYAHLAHTDDDAIRQALAPYAAGAVAPRIVPEIEA